jgi:sulfatase maturation enzyme AslB (radical SAM superfamily)
LIQYIVPRAKKRARLAGKELDIVVTTNLANATDDMLLYFHDENVKVSTSLDGPAFIHNANRPRPGNNSYELTISNIERARKIVGKSRVAALMTTTQLSLHSTLVPASKGPLAPEIKCSDIFAGSTKAASYGCTFWQNSLTVRYSD